MKGNLRRCSLTILALTLLTTGCTTPSRSTPKTPQETLAWWQSARFGIFIHWSPYAMFEPYSIQRDDWETLREFKTFNPRAFDAEQWFKAIERSGARYTVFTAKHMFGFPMFDDPDTEFDIINTPYGKDVCMRIARAAEAANMPLLWYFSTMGGLNNPEEFARKAPLTYDEHRYRQVHKLLTQYGNVRGIWWDGGQQVQPELIEMARQAQPHLIMNWRIGAEGYTADFITTEQRIGEFNADKPWENSITLEEFWFWSGGKHTKDLETCLGMLVQSAGADGNLLLNISPKPDGTLAHDQVAVLEGIGAWLQKYGKAIYDTRGGPYKPGAWGVSTRRDNKVYLFLTQRNTTGKLHLPPLPANIRHYRTLTQGLVTINQSAFGLEIELGPRASHRERTTEIGPGTLVELTLDSNAMHLAPIETGRGTPLSHDATATASSMASTNHSPDAVITHSDLQNDLATYGRATPKESKLPYTFCKRELNFKKRYWGPADTDTEPWIEIDFGEPATFSSIQIRERIIYRKQVKRFEIQYHNGTDWTRCYEGGEIGHIAGIKFAPITARKLRLLITETHDAPPNILSIIVE